MRVKHQIEVNCETDFVAKNDDFIKFVKELSEINYNCNSDLNKIKSFKMKNSQTVDENLVAIISKIGEKIPWVKVKLFLIKIVLTSNIYTVVKDNLSKLAVVVSLETSDKSEKFQILVNN